MCSRCGGISKLLFVYIYTVCVFTKIPVLSIVGLNLNVLLLVLCCKLYLYHSQKGFLYPIWLVSLIIVRKV